MTIRKVKTSVVEEPYETYLSGNVNINNNSTCVRSDNSSRKWKVSESITPIMSESERFPLRISFEKSTRSFAASSNETFEKNAEFNIPNYPGRRSSNSSKTSFLEDPFFQKFRHNKRSNKVISSVADNDNSALHQEDVDDVRLSNDENSLQNLQNLSRFGSPIMHSSLRQSLITDESSEKIPATVCAKPLISQIIKEEDESDTVLPVRRRRRKAKELANLSISNQTQSNDDDENKKNCESNIFNQLKENIKSKEESKYKIYDDNMIKRVADKPNCDSPVDLDDDERKNEVILKNEKSPQVQKEFFQSRLCDMSKSYLHSQDSSFISSPLEKKEIKDATNLPGKNIKMESEKLSTSLKNQSLENNQEPVEKQFFKTSFNERRNQEIQKFQEAIKIKDTNKSIEKPQKPKRQLKKNRKEDNKETVKNNKLTVKKINQKNCEKKAKAILLSDDSDKEAVKKINIEDSEKDLYNSPIEKGRCATPDNEYNYKENSDDDLFAFTPKIEPQVTKHKGSKRKQQQTRTKVNKQTKRQKKIQKPTDSEQVYDIVSSPISSSPKIKVVNRPSYLNYGVRDKISKRKNNAQVKSNSLSDSIVLCEHYVELTKFQLDSISFQLKQMKDMSTF